VRAVPGDQHKESEETAPWRRAIEGNTVALEREAAEDLKAEHRALRSGDLTGT
jgi:hypothetical protein